MQRKSLKPWILLIALPIPLLLVMAMLQLTVRAAFRGESNIIMVLFNILSLAVGMATVLMIIGFPVWVVMLILASNHNSKLSKQPENTPKLPPTSTPPASNQNSNNPGSIEPSE